MHDPSDFNDEEPECVPSAFLPEDLVLKAIAPDGPLSRCLKGFECREQQKQMLLAILKAYNQNEIALIEAGTGTGKSMAYLIPAILWALKFQQRTVISTHTITLQEQLIHKDIPLLTKALGVDIKAVLVKGIGNYVCLRKLKEIKYQFNLLSPTETAELEKIEAWSQSTREGSRASLPLHPSQTVWELVGAEHDTCNNRKCDHYKDCYYFKARKQAQEAQILVANHHLLCSDLLKKEDENIREENCIMPFYSRVILDEAHNLENVATDFFADQISLLEVFKMLHKLSTDKPGEALGKLMVLQRAIEGCYQKEPPQEITFILKRLMTDIPGLRWDVWNQTQVAFEGFAQFARMMQDRTGIVQEDLQPGEIKHRLREFHQTHPDWQENILPKAKKLAEQMQQYLTAIVHMEKDLKAVNNDRLHEMIKSILFDISALTDKLSGYHAILQNFLHPEFPKEKVRWIEVQHLQRGANISLIDADLDVSKALVKFLFSQFNTIILCSATLTANQDFKFIRQRLGLVPEKLKRRALSESVFDSPFDFKRQALFAIPTDMPLPSHPQFLPEAVEHIWKILQISRGNAFVLFTSYSMLNECYGKLNERLKSQGFHPLKQGETNRGAMLSRFKSVDRSVLFGTESFWEGVDVVGEALRCVILVKLPFKVPSEPIIQARSEAIIARGGDPFFEYALPHAIVKFKQGFGRLIRNKRDRGCVVCLDSRLLNKGYGRLFLQSLPDCQQLFKNSEELYPAMSDFYRKTYSLVVSKNS